MKQRMIYNIITEQKQKHSPQNKNVKNNSTALLTVDENKIPY